MSIRRKIGHVIVVALTLLFFVLSSTDLIINDDKEEVKNVMVITEEITGVEYQNFKRGIQESANKHRVNVNMAEIRENQSEEEILTHLQHEFDENVQAIIIQAECKEVIQKFLAQQEMPRPVIEVNSFSNYAGQVSTVMVDLKEAARLLAEKIEKDCGKDTEAVLLLCESDREKGIGNYLKTTFEEAGLTLAEQTVSMGEALTITEAARTNRVYVSCCAAITEHAAKYLEDEVLYGIGYSDEVMKLLQNDEVDGIAAYSMYSLGIHAIHRAVEAIENGNPEESTLAECRWITKENLEGEYEFLFPIY